ncbi:MAG TPA: hypothetical protein DHW78_04230 [Ruminococcaceae bacterium]|nr:hypothetical protein [Oscillospiraceae bacterium]
MLDQIIPAKVFVFPVPVFCGITGTAGIFFYVFSRNLKGPLSRKKLFLFPLFLICKAELTENYFLFNGRYAII